MIIAIKDWERREVQVPMSNVSFVYLFDPTNLLDYLLFIFYYLLSWQLPKKCAYVYEAPAGY